MLYVSLTVLRLSDYTNEVGRLGVGTDGEKRSSIIIASTHAALNHRMVTTLNTEVNVD